MNLHIEIRIGFVVPLEQTSRIQEMGAIVSVMAENLSVAVNLEIKARYHKDSDNVSW